MMNESSLLGHGEEKYYLLVVSQRFQLNAKLVGLKIRHVIIIGKWSNYFESYMYVISSIFIFYYENEKSKCEL